MASQQRPNVVIVDVPSSGGVFIGVSGRRTLIKGFDHGKEKRLHRELCVLATPTKQTK